MSKEIEAQILYIDYDTTIKKIKSLGAKMKFDWVKFRIAVFHPCMSEKERNEKYEMIFTRVRDEGLGTVTITTKTKPKITPETSARTKKFVNEHEITTTHNTFEDCRDLLLANHLNMKAYQERLRQKWIIPGRPEIKEIVFDIWVGLPMHMEIEAATEKHLMDFIDEVGLDKNNVRYTGASKFYEEILSISTDNINNNTPLLDFKNALSQLSPHIKMDKIDSHIYKEKLQENIRKQREFLNKIGFANLYKHENKQSSANSKFIKTKKTKKTKKTRKTRKTRK